ncbi:MAG TPA: NAD(P)-dependent oxidoreductase [Actinocrinis sp.]|nr:NAD(P)-dependent oxidoreductase [Actinocrinis sp.]
MRIFFAGATGAIGRLLLPQLLSEGHTIIATTRSDRGAQQLREAGAEAVQLDVFDRAAVAETVRAAAPDAVMHQLTALGELDFAANSRIRIEGTRNLVDAALAAGVERIVAQSIAWVYRPGNRPAAESEPLDRDAADPRGRTIAAVDALETASAELPQHVILRYGALYGPGTWYSRDEMVAGRLRRGEIPADDAVTSFVHVEDAAQAAAQALEWPSGTYNVVDDEPAAARDWVPVLAEVFGATVPEPTAGGQAWERGADNARASAQGLKLRYPSWREGFQSLR